MSVYIDNSNIPFKGMIMCHMIADTDEELYEMVDKIGLQRRWRHNNHYDVCLSKKKLAIEYGAKEVSVREIVRILLNKRLRK